MANIEEYETLKMRRLYWVGDSKKNIRALPDGARKLIGDELQLIQYGEMPKDAK